MQVPFFRGEITTRNRRSLTLNCPCCSWTSMRPHNSIHPQVDGAEKEICDEIERGVKVNQRLGSYLFRGKRKYLCTLSNCIFILFYSN